MDILKNTQFLKLWGNQILLQIAFNMCNFTALLLISQVTGSRTSLAQFYAAMTLPAFAVGFFAGAIVDMSNRKKLMLVTDSLLSILFFAYALSGHNLEAILLIAFLSASVSQFFTPAEAATIPLLVKDESLHQANSLFLFTGLGSVMAGYALAGPVIQTFGGIDKSGAQAAFIIAGVLTALGLLLRLSLKTIETVRPEVTGKRIFAHTLMLAKEVIAETRGKHTILMPIILLTLMEFNIGMLAIIFIDYVKKYLQLPPTATSYYLVIPLIIGLGIGTYLLNFSQKYFTRGRSIFFAIVSFGLVLLALGISALLFGGDQLGILVLRVITVAAAIVIGVAAVFIAVHSRTILQENTPEHMLGRVFSLVTVSASAITPVPVLLIALFTEKLDVSVIFIAFGLTLGILGLLLNPTLQHHLK